MKEAYEAVLTAGGGMLGEIITKTTPAGGIATAVYVCDPEGNIIEAQRQALREALKNRALCRESGAGEAWGLRSRPAQPAQLRRVRCARSEAPRYHAALDERGKDESSNYAIASSEIASGVW